MGGGVYIVRIYILVQGGFGGLDLARAELQVVAHAVYNGAAARVDAPVVDAALEVGHVRPHLTHIGPQDEPYKHKPKQAAWKGSVAFKNSSLFAAPFFHFRMEYFSTKKKKKKL